MNPTERQILKLVEEGHDPNSVAEALALDLEEVEQCIAAHRLHSNLTFEQSISGSKMEALRVIQGLLTADSEPLRLKAATAIIEMSRGAAEDSVNSMGDAVAKLTARRKEIRAQMPSNVIDLDDKLDQELAQAAKEAPGQLVKTPWKSTQKVLSGGILK